MTRSALILSVGRFTEQTMFGLYRFPALSRHPVVVTWTISDLPIARLHNQFAIFW
jgi:hypothetical protein